MPPDMLPDDDNSRQLAREHYLAALRSGAYLQYSGDLHPGPEGSVSALHLVYLLFRDWSVPGSSTDPVDGLLGSDFDFDLRFCLACWNQTMSFPAIANRLEEVWCTGEIGEYPTLSGELFAAPNYSLLSDKPTFH